MREGFAPPVQIKRSSNPGWFFCMHRPVFQSKNVSPELWIMIYICKGSAASDMSQQKRAEVVAKFLWEKFISPDHGARVALTGAIIPYGSLKSAALRKQLAWVEALANKFVTLAVARRSIKLLLKKYHVNVPVIPGVSKDEWAQTQAQRVVKMCYRMKKNAKARQMPRKTRAQAMDDTLVYDGEARQEMFTSRDA